MPNVAALSQPLVTRPGYGQGRPALPMASVVAESGLPGGGPSDRGLPLDSSIPGTSTFNKPEDDVRDFDKGTDTPIYRKDGPDDQLKDRDRIDVREDWAQNHDGIGGMGKGEWDTTIKTKYPYRGDRPYKHYASASDVLELYRLRYARSLFLPGADNVRIAVRMDDVVSGLSPAVQQRAQTCSASVKRADIPNLRWIFTVDCGNGAKMVRIKARRAPNITRFAKLDLAITCSCPGWQWLGPEFHARGKGYLDGQPRGTASTPDIRDPKRVNKVCKHVAAVLAMVRSWELPKSKSKPKKK